MIAIVNISKEDVSPFGINQYELRINNDVICKFKHDRSKGLSDCLYQAWKAYEKHKFEKAHKLLDLPDTEIKNKSEF